MLARTYQWIGIEDLNVRGMVRNRHLSRSVIEGAFFEFRRQLDYKSRLYGSTIVVADRWFPSSKICSCCGVVKDTLDLNERTFRCDDCGFECDRRAGRERAESAVCRRARAPRLGILLESCSPQGGRGPTRPALAPAKNKAPPASPATPARGSTNRPCVGTRVGTSAVAGC